MLSVMLMSLALLSQQDTYKLTAYAACPKCCGYKRVYLTKMQTKADYRRRIVAVDPRHIRLGSRIYIKGYGYYRAEDTGRLVKGHHIDILMKSYWQAKQFGKQQGKVVIV